MREVVAHAATAFHELYLLLVDAYDAAVGVGLAVQAYDEAVGERAHLQVVADAAHGAALGHDVAEVAQELEDFVLAHGVGILALYAADFRGQAAVHVVGRQLKDVCLRVFEGILAHPYTGGQFVAVKVFQRGLVGLIVTVCLAFHGKYNMGGY